MSSATSASTRDQSRRPAPRSRYAQRTCLNCRKSKTRCQLPDLTTPSSSLALPHDKACHRCVSLELDCVVDDSRRRTTKSGTARYGLDGLLQRANTSSSSIQPPTPGSRYRPYASDRSSSSPLTLSNLTSAADRRSATRRQGARNTSTSSSRRISRSSNVRSGTDSSTTPSHGASMSGQSCSSTHVTQGALRSDLHLPDPLQPGFFDLVYSDLSIALAAIAATTSTTLDTGSNRLHCIGTSNAPSSASLQGAPIFLRALQAWNPFLLSIEPDNTGAERTAGDLLDLSLRHILYLLSHGSNEIEHSADVSPEADEGFSSLEHAQLNTSRDRLLVDIATLFLGRGQPSLRKVQALILLCLYDPPDLFLPLSSLEAEHNERTLGRQSEGRRASSLPSPPGLHLVELATTVSERVHLCSCIECPEHLFDKRASPAEASAHAENLLTLVALFNLQVGYASSGALASSSSSRLHSLLRENFDTVLDRIELFVASHEDDDEQMPYFRKVAIDALASQFKMNLAFAQTFSCLASLPSPASTSASEIEELHRTFRLAVQAAVTRFAHNHRQGSSTESRAWLSMLRVQAADAELILWSHCIYLELGVTLPNSGSPRPQANSEQGASSGAMDYGQIFEILRAHDFRGARFLATVTERCTDLAHVILKASKVLLGSSAELVAEGSDELQLQWAPLMPRCLAVFRCTKTLSQLWMLVLQKWSTISARLDHALQMLNDAACELDDQDARNAAKLIRVTSQFLLRTNQMLRQMYQDKQEALAQDHLQVLHELAGNPASIRQSSVSADGQQRQAPTPLAAPTAESGQVDSQKTRQTQALASVTSPGHLRHLHHQRGLQHQQLQHSQSHNNQIAGSSQALPPPDAMSSSTDAIGTWPNDGINWDDVLSWGFLNV